MRWEAGRRSTNIEDRRGMGGAGIVGGGGIGMLILVLIISFISGRNPLELLQQVEETAPPAESAPTGTPPADDPQAQMVSSVLASTEDTWQRLFQQIGRFLVPWYGISDPEQELAALLQSVGPVIGIGQPGETLPDLGAARMYVSDDAWRATVDGRGATRGPDGNPIVGGTGGRVTGTFTVPERKQ